MVTFLEIIRDRNSQSEGEAIVNTDDILVSGDSNTQVDTITDDSSYGANDSNTQVETAVDTYFYPAADSNFQVETTCTQMTRHEVIADGNNGVDGIGDIAGTWDNPNNSELTPTLGTDPTSGFTPLNSTYVEIIDDRNVQKETILLLLNGSPVTTPQCPN